MPKDAAVEEFARLVRALKARDGRSYEALGRRLSVSASTLHRYCSGATVPEEFAVVDRLALLCGADEEERRALEVAWTRADGARRPVPEPAPEPTPEPEPEAAPETEPEPEPSLAPGTTTDAERAAPPRPHSRSRSRSRSQSRSRRGLLVAGAVAAVVALALALVLVRIGLSAGTEATAAPTSKPLTPTRTTAPDPPPPPFTWTADSHTWENGCGHTYLVDRAPSGVAPPPPPSDAARWAGTHRAVHGGETLVRISLQGRSPSASVVLQALHVRVVGRAAPLPWTAYRMDNGCGGALTPRHYTIDLDASRPLVRPVDGYDASGEGHKIPSVPFPYTVTSSDPEELLVTAGTAGCDCRWYLELVWSSEGRSGTVRIADGAGKPFRTSGIEGRPVREYDVTGGRWITGEGSGQSG